MTWSFSSFLIVCVFCLFNRMLVSIGESFGVRGSFCLHCSILMSNPHFQSFFFFFSLAHCICLGCFFFFFYFFAFKPVPENQPDCQQQRPLLEEDSRPRRHSKASEEVALRYGWAGWSRWQVGNICHSVWNTWFYKLHIKIKEAHIIYANLQQIWRRFHTDTEACRDE